MCFKAHEWYCCQQHEQRVSVLEQHYSSPAACKTGSEWAFLLLGGSSPAGSICPFLMESSNGTSLLSVLPAGILFRILTSSLFRAVLHKVVSTTVRRGKMSRLYTTMPCGTVSGLGLMPQTDHCRQTSAKRVGSFPMRVPTNEPNVVTW